ncbi:MAG: NADH-quinone oxidoreductase subunit C [Gammaproteobacteria bacterium]
MARLEASLADRILELREDSPRRIYVEVRPCDIYDASRLMFEELGARFQIASGIDTPSAIELLYHWAFDRLGCVVTVRTRLDRDTPEIDSITPVCVAAEWIEREIWELLGVRFKDHPDMRHLLLADDWPQGKYPLRRDYEK